MNDSNLRVISLGAGVQSSTLLLMAHEGEIEADAAVFADTQWEPAAVYEHLDWLESVSSVPIHRVTAGKLREDALSSRRSASMPLHVLNQNGSPGMLRRQCTKEYKIQPVRRWMQANRDGRHVELLFGISLDEWQRMRDSDRQYVSHHYPLVDRRMSRLDCLNWLESYGYPRPPRSACIGCPYHSNVEWRSIRENPDEWQDAIEFDAAVRGMARIDGDAYLHRQLVPLAVADIRSDEERGQISFLDECEGMCGV